MGLLKLSKSVWEHSLSALGVAEYRYRDKLKKDMLSNESSFTTKVIVQLISTIGHRTTNLELVRHWSNLLF